MIADCFLDTNILVYAVTESDASRDKHAKAVELISSTEFWVSAQVLQEFYVVATRKLSTPLSPSAALTFIEKIHCITFSTRRW